ncbi:MAG: HlyD family efflux transporter periplasmic adaptor subunit [Planctomycetota bacterium]
MMFACRFLFPVALFSCVALSGCGRDEKVIPAKRPRPVVTEVLSQQSSPSAALVAASVGSWKTEQIGFEEVGGRVEFVVERNTEVEGRITDRDGQRISDGTPVARIESERFKLNVELAKAEVAQAEQNLIVAETNRDETIPAQIAAAKANEVLALAELNRQKRLFNSNAGSQNDFDVAKANADTAQSRVKEALAQQTAKKAEIKSLENVVLQAKQSLRDANRDLEDCTLYASFQGLISQTEVVPGSVVKPGEPVATLQMMNPIKVELEVSAEQSRQLRRTEIFPVHVTMADGSTEIHDGFLYQIDTLADPLSRTFTLTLLVLNQKLREYTGSQLATTSDIWRLTLPFIQGSDADALYVDEAAILDDGQGPYLWQITNATIQNRSLQEQIFDVRKLRVTPREKKIPFFGDLVFQQIDITDPEFDPNVHLVVGEIAVSDGLPEQWNGSQIVLDSGVRWMLRPGELVKVDLSNQTLQGGFYVPMDAIARQDGQTSIFIVDESGEKTTVKRTPILIVDETSTTTTSSLRQIMPLGGVSLEGARFVTKGAHYLVDGEEVSIVSNPGGSL